MPKCSNPTTQLIDSTCLPGYAWITIDEQIQFEKSPVGRRIVGLLNLRYSILELLSEHSPTPPQETSATGLMAMVGNTIHALAMPLLTAFYVSRAEAIAKKHIPGILRDQEKSKALELVKQQIQREVLKRNPEPRSKKPQQPSEIYHSPVHAKSAKHDRTCNNTPPNSPDAKHFRPS